MSTPTPAQARAIDSDCKDILCVAGPGAGKTTVLVRRICRLLEAGVRPDQIVALTFTNAAARELEKRLYASAPNPRAPGFDRLGYCGALHGFALKMLKEQGGRIGYGDRLSIIGQEAADDLVLSKAKQLGCKTRLGKLLELKAAGRPTSERKTPDELVICGYYDDLREAGMVDFDIMLTEFLRMLISDAQSYSSNWGQFSHLFVDEVQDSGAVDWKIYLALPMENKFFVGDPDQAIYGFRGGRVHEMIAYGMRPKVERILLEENFRSRDEICDAATKLIGNNKERIAKATVGVKGPGGTVVPFEADNEGSEISWVSNRLGLYMEDDGGPLLSFAVLARTNAVAAAFREGLGALGVPVAKPPETKLPKDWALARQFVTWLANPENDTLAFFYLIAVALHRGDAPDAARATAHAAALEAKAGGKSINAWFGEARPTLGGVGQRLAAARISAEARALVIEKIKQLGPDADLLELAWLMNQQEPGGQAGEDQAGVVVTTIHGAKGREWDVVFLVGFEDEIIPGKRGEVEEERRLAYVGLTRARQGCYITSAGTRKALWGYQPIEPHVPSRFVKEILP